MRFITPRQRTRALAAIAALVGISACNSTRNAEIATPAQPAAAEPVEPMTAAKTFTSVIEGSVAPDFALAPLAGGGPITPKSLNGRPSVLLFGSCTSPAFVESFEQMNLLHRDFEDRVNFVVVYIREAHPLDGDAIPDNRFKVSTPRTIDDRMDAALQLKRAARIRMPIAIDGLDDAMIEPYRAWPSRIVILDPRGVAVYAPAASPDATRHGARRLRSVLNRVLRNG